MSRKHLVFIINPKSGVDRQKAIQDAIDTTLDHNQFSYEIGHTEYAKHGIELAAAAAANGAYAVIAVGGDGSVNDVMKGLLGTQTILAIIPKGSGNGMARTMGIPLNEQAALQLINRGNAVNIDIGYANGEPFISNAGVAFDALISKKFSKSKRRGFINYSWLVTKHLWLYKSWNWSIELDGRQLKEKAFMISVANGRQFGYNFRIAPAASWTDGLFDVVVIRKFPKILGGLLAVRGLTGTILQSPYVKHYLAKDVVLEHPGLNLMQLDGDAHSCASRIHFVLKQDMLRVVVP